MINHFDTYFSQVNSFFRNKETEHKPDCYLCGTNVRFTYQRTFTQLYYCKCGFFWLANQPTLAVLDEFYKQSEAMTIWSEIKDGKDDQRQNDKYSLFWNHIKKEKLESVLDVGCGNGYFLHNCPPGIDLMGVEPNADSARHCSVPIINPSEIRGKFDLVTFFGVMEHLKDPIAVLNHYVQFVENDGYIGIIVPNINSLAFDILGDENCTICPQHLWYFSINTLSTLMEKVGFKLHSFNTQETEYQPIVRKLHGISPYNKCGGLELDHPAIKEKDILKHNLGTKICAIYKKGV